MARSGWNSSRLDGCISCWSRSRRRRCCRPGGCRGRCCPRSGLEHGEQVAGGRVVHQGQVLVVHLGRVGDELIGRPGGGATGGLRGDGPVGLGPQRQGHGESVTGEAGLAGRLGATRLPLGDGHAGGSRAPGRRRQQAVGGGEPRARGLLGRPGQGEAEEEHDDEAEEGEGPDKGTQHDTHLLVEKRDMVSSSLSRIPARS